MKNRILLENYFLPGDLEAQIEAFVDHYNHRRCHENLNNVTAADVSFGRDKAILQKREKIKRKTLETRREHHRQCPSPLKLGHYIGLERGICNGTETAFGRRCIEAAA